MSSGNADPVTEALANSIGDDLQETLRGSILGIPMEEQREKLRAAAEFFLKSLPQPKYYGVDSVEVDPDEPSKFLVRLRVPREWVEEGDPSEK